MNEQESRNELSNSRFVSMELVDESTDAQNR